MPRGGRRQGQPGKNYPNRTDLAANRQPIQAASGQEYGQRKAQEDAQRAIPLPAAQTQAQVQAEPYPLPGSFGAFDRPTEYPDEPVTAGISSGPGPGPEALGFPLDDPVLELRRLYQMTQDEAIRELIEDAE